MVLSSARTRMVLVAWLQERIVRMYIFPNIFLWLTRHLALRIIRVLDPSEKHASEHKAVIGPGGYRIEASRNQWAGSGLKIDSALTDVVWCHKGIVYFYLAPTRANLRL